MYTSTTTNDSNHDAKRIRRAFFRATRRQSAVPLMRIGAT